MDLIFYAERLMVIFWAGVQQICFVWLRIAYDDAARTGRSRRAFLLSQAALMAAVAAACFAHLSGAVLQWDGPSWASIYPLVRYDSIFCFVGCSAMIYFDSMLTLYAFRHLRLLKRGLPQRVPTAADIAVFAAVFGGAALYWHLTDGAAASLGASVDEYVAVRKAFVQISNFCYIVLEIVIGAIFFKLWRTFKEVRSDG